MSWTPTIGTTRATPSRARPEEGRSRPTGKFFTYNVALNYSGVLLLADAIERAASRRPQGDHRRRSPTSTFAGHIMPYGPTQFVNGQNAGAAPVNTQVQDGDIKVIFPTAFADAKPVFPVPPEARRGACSRPTSSPRRSSTA